MSFACYYFCAVLKTNTSTEGRAAMSAFIPDMKQLTALFSEWQLSGPPWAVIGARFKMWRLREGCCSLQSFQRYKRGPMQERAPQSWSRNIHPNQQLTTNPLSTICIENSLLLSSSLLWSSPLWPLRSHKRKVLNCMSFSVACNSCSNRSIS